MKNVKKINLSSRSLVTMIIITIVATLIIIVGFVFLGVSSVKLTSYEQSMLMVDNPGITYVTYSPNEKQAEELSQMQCVKNVETMRLIERNNLSFTNDVTSFIAIESFNNTKSLENTLFNNILIGDSILDDNEIYFDQILFQKCNVKIGEKVTVSFGATLKSFILGGVVSPVRDILTLKNDGVAIINFSDDIDEGLPSETRITCLTITTRQNYDNFDELLIYLANYKPLGNIQTFEQFNNDYRSMHNQGAYSDEEYAEIIQKAYDKYYSETYEILPKGQYTNSDTFFRDLTNSFELKSINESSMKYGYIFLLLVCLGTIIQFISLFIPSIKSDLINSKNEGSNPKILIRQIFFRYDLPFCVVMLVANLIFVFIDLLNIASVISILYLISIVILVVYLILSLIRNRIILKIKTYQN